MATPAAAPSRIKEGLRIIWNLLAFVAAHRGPVLAEFQIQVGWTHILQSHRTMELRRASPQSGITMNCITSNIGREQVVH
jgi:hypothetical protein